MDERKSITGPKCQTNHAKMHIFFERKYFEGTDTLRVPPRNKRGVIPKNQKGLRPNSFATLNLFMRA